MSGEDNEDEETTGYEESDDKRVTRSQARREASEVEKLRNLVQVLLADKAAEEVGNPTPCFRPPAANAGTSHAEQPKLMTGRGVPAQTIYERKLNTPTNYIYTTIHFQAYIVLLL